MAAEGGIQPKRRTSLLIVFTQQFLFHISLI